MFFFFNLVHRQFLVSLQRPTLRQCREYLTHLAIQAILLCHEHRDVQQDREDQVIPLKLNEATTGNMRNFSRHFRVRNCTCSSLSSSAAKSRSSTRSHETWIASLAVFTICSVLARCPRLSVRSILTILPRSAYELKFNYIKRCQERIRTDDIPGGPTNPCFPSAPCFPSTPSRPSFPWTPTRPFNK